MKSDVIDDRRRSLSMALLAVGIATAGCAVDAGSGAQDVPEDTPLVPLTVTATQLEPVISERDGLTRAVEFWIDADVTSFALMLRSDVSTQCMPAMLRSPGADLIDDDWWRESASASAVRCAECANPVSSHPGETTVLVPAAPDVAVVPGSWTVTVRCVDVDARAPVSTRVEPQLVVRRGAPEPGRVLELPVNVVVASSAPHIEARVDRMLETAQETWEAADIRFSPVRRSRSTPLVVDGVRDFPTLFAQGAALEPGVTVFVVERIGPEPVSPTESSTIGQVGAVPGPVWRQGGPAAGIVLASTPWEVDEPDPLGNVLAHELGHYLGLFHTVDYSGATDPLPDTDDYDGRNLMHWYVDATPRVLSPQQIEIVRGNPWLSGSVSIAR